MTRFTRTFQMLLLAVACAGTSGGISLAWEKAVYPYCPEAPCSLPWKKPPCFCPDDYCPKCLPNVRPFCGGLCDDYCRKCLPNVMPETCGSCDNYCPKKGPIRFGTCMPAWWKCGPPIHETCSPLPTAGERLR